MNSSSKMKKKNTLAHQKSYRKSVIINEIPVMRFG